MMNYKYHLPNRNERHSNEAYRRKYECPQCGFHTFVPYLDESGKIVDVRKYGRCERINSCGYVLYPESNENTTTRNYRPIYTPKPKAKFLNAEQREIYFKPTLKNYEENHLISYLRGVFDDASITKMIENYYIGTIEQFNGGATVFWQIDRFGNIHRGKVMQYDKNGHRAKRSNGNGLVNSIHNIYGISDLPQECLFGEHLLSKFPNMFVGLVESEKTAIIASGVIDDCLFLATGGCSKLTPAMCNALKGRNVVLFPDNGKFEEWSEKGRAMRHIFKTISIVDIMEHEDVLECYNLSSGDDIGDIIISPNFDIRHFHIELKEL